MPPAWRPVGTPMPALWGGGERARGGRGTPFPSQRGDTPPSVATSTHEQEGKERGQGGGGGRGKRGGPSAGETVRLLGVRLPRAPPPPRGGEPRLLRVSSRPRISPRRMHPTLFFSRRFSHCVGLPPERYPPAALAHEPHARLREHVCRSKRGGRMDGEGKRGRVEHKSRGPPTTIMENNRSRTDCPHAKRTCSVPRRLRCRWGHAPTRPVPPAAATQAPGRGATAAAPTAVAVAAATTTTGRNHPCTPPYPTRHPRCVRVQWRRPPAERVGCGNGAAAPAAVA